MVQINIHEIDLTRNFNLDMEEIAEGDLIIASGRKERILKISGVGIRAGGKYRGLGIMNIRAVGRARMNERVLSYTDYRLTYAPAGDIIRWENISKDSSRFIDIVNNPRRYQQLIDFLNQAGVYRRI